MKNILGKIVLLSLIVGVSACNKAENASNDTSKEEVVSSEDLIDGREMIENQLYTDDGLKVYFNAKGARVEKITFNDKQIAKDGFVVGRCANRIAEGKFSLYGTEYQLTKNNNGNHLHGGDGGGANAWQGPFANATWTKVDQTAATITYSLHSDDGDQGYPGNMDMTVTYTLRQSGELSIEYKATTDKDTLCNPTNHLYMSLNGNTSYDNIDLFIDADSYTPLNSNQLPTGEILPVEGTKFDYREEQAFRGSESYDDNYVLKGEGYRKVATMTGKTLGVKVDVFTDRPGLQLYKAGQGAICLESQMFPDAINHGNFESPILKAGDEFVSKTAYLFSAVE